MWAFLCFECELLSLILLSITSESINSDKSYQILVLLSVPSLFFEAHGNWFLAQVDLVFQNLSQKVHTQHTLLKIIISNWIFHHVNTQKTVCSSFNISMWTTILFQIRVLCHLFINNRSITSNSYPYPWPVQALKKTTGRSFS